MYPVIRAAWFAAVLVLILPVVGRAQPVRVALSGVTTAPAPAPGVGLFTGFDHAPSVSGGVVAFRGLYGGGEGIYQRTATGNLLRIASSPSSVPGGGTFDVFGSPTASGLTVLFAGGQAIGAPPFIPFRGVYASHVTGMVTVADLTTPSPSNGLPFGGFAPPAVSGATAAFFAGNPGALGIYTRATSGIGAVSKVADTLTTIPGTGLPFAGFTLPTVSGSTVAFTGGNGPTAGVFTAPAGGGGLTTVANTATPIPNGGGAVFGALGAPAISGSFVAFTGSPGGAPGPTGVYAKDGAGPLVRVADLNTAAPGGPGLFTQFDAPVSVFGDDVVFVGHSATGPGVYTNATGSLTRLVGAGDTFDGRTVADVEIGRQSFDGSVVTFWAGFTDGSSGIYVAPVPEPAGVLAIGVVAAGLLRLTRHRLA